MIVACPHPRDVENGRLHSPSSRFACVVCHEENVGVILGLQNTPMIFILVVASVGNAIEASHFLKIASKKLCAGFCPGEPNE